MGNKEKFGAKLAKALKKMKENNAESVEVPIDFSELAGVGDNLGDILSKLSGKEGKPNDDTPVKPETISLALEILARLTKPEAVLQDYVEAFSHIVLVHSEMHDAPVFLTKYHEHVLDFGEAVQNIAGLRFGDKVFQKAAKEWQDGLLQKTRATVTDELLSASDDYFKTLRPKNRAN